MAPSPKDSGSLTIVTQTYGQPIVLSKWVEVHSHWPEELKAKTGIIIVDDHGTPPVTKEELAPLHGFSYVHRYRIMTDVPWNQPVCRNLAIARAKTSAILTLDIDMMVEPADAPAFVQAAEQLPRGTVIKWGLRDVIRKNLKGKPYVNMSSPNTWLFHRKDFLAVGGYDPGYSGAKGWSDVELMHVLTCAYKVVKRPDLVVSWYSKCMVGFEDALVKSINREHGTNKKKHLKTLEKVNGRFGGDWAKWAKHERVTRKMIPVGWTLTTISPSKTSDKSGSSESGSTSLRPRDTSTSSDSAEPPQTPPTSPTGNTPTT